jgi:hypothetical protein
LLVQDVLQKFTIARAASTKGVARKASKGRCIAITAAGKASDGLHGTKLSRTHSSNNEFIGELVVLFLPLDRL